MSSPQAKANEAQPEVLTEVLASPNQKGHPKACGKPVITHNAEYISGIKIYDIGILEDPVPGEKRGRGKQHLTSSYWIYDLGVFINRNFLQMQAMAQYAYEHSKRFPGYDFRYFINVSNALFLKSEGEGLRTKDGRDFFLMASWLAMAAAEVDGFLHAKYSAAQRAAQREAFYKKYLDPSVMWVPDEEDDTEFEALLGKYAVESCRIDMIPPVALERLGIHNELCALKFKDPTHWMRDGFAVSTRIDSMKRHFEAIHAKNTSEDHLAHLIWGFMAVTHDVAVFPQKNDLIDFESIRRSNVRAADTTTRAIVGDGGFRSAGSRQSCRQVPDDLSSNAATTPAAARSGSCSRAERGSARSPAASPWHPQEAISLPARLGAARTLQVQESGKAASGGHRSPRKEPSGCVRSIISLLFC